MRKSVGCSQQWGRRIACSAAAASLGAALVGSEAVLAAPTTAPPVTILTSSPFVSPGYFFISPFGGQTTYANGAEILDHSGNVIWFHAVPAGQEASDFRVQHYRGKPVLTWWQGAGLGGLAQGVDYIYDDHYRQIATVNAGNGLSADGHEFLITPRNTALILAYAAATADLTSIGGPANQAVINGVVQEIDIRTGKVLFQWNSEDHVPFSESQQPLPGSASSPWDWFHVNAIKIDADGNYLIDARDTWTAYKVSRKTGAIVWRLGGKNSTFKLEAAPGQTLNNAGKIFAWQHDPEALGDNTYTFFDNESAGAGNTGSGATNELGYSRAVTVRLNERKHIATLIKSDKQPEGLIAPSQGNAQTTDRDNLVVGWGSLPYFSEFNRSGNLLFNAQFPAGVNTYRAYLLPWRPGRLELGSH
ncbi:arylsulfotransferase family protein [Methylocella silvestris]|uniref:arylsulfotransferase family protein n=1 Tax=Methylocella silvestris TaxID=199596 RepID=UPI001AEC12B4|nr:arylsulfotransferase family protein [Methylocella silvestris]